MKYSNSVCIVGEFPPPFGGMSIQAQLLSKYLCREKIKIIHVKRHASFPRFLRWVEKVKILRAIIRFVFFVSNCLVLMPKAKTVIIFSNSGLNFYMYSIIPFFIGKILRKKTIINYHGGAAKEFLHKRQHFLPRIVLQMAENLIVPSEFLAEIFQEFGCSPYIIPNIINLESFSFKERNIFSPRCIVTRHLEPEYNIEMIVKAFELINKKLPDAKLIICGKGSQETMLKKSVEKLNLQEKITFVGHIPNDKLPEFYEKNDIFLNASKVDNFPVSILEAFACGLPVVSTNAGGIPYLVEHNKTGVLVDIDDYNFMAESVIKIVNNQDFARMLVVNAKKSLKRYIWDNVKPKMFEILNIRQL